MVEVVVLVWKCAHGPFPPCGESGCRGN